MSMQERLSKLRALMTECCVDGYVIPSEDSHQSEYPLKPDCRREFISNFTGSSGIALVTKEKAYLWTDGRYFLQAAAQLDGALWTLCKQGTPDCPKFSEIVDGEVKRLGFDPFVVSRRWVEEMKGKLQKAQLRPIHGGSFGKSGDCEYEACLQDICIGQLNLVDKVWGESRPAYPAGPIVAMTESGESTDSKLHKVRKAMEEKHADLLVLAKLSQLAWLANVRGTDVEFSRIFLAYGVVTKSDFTIYVKNAEAKDRVPLAYMQQNGVKIVDYDAMISDFVETILKLEAPNVWVDSDVNLGVYYVAEEAVRTVKGSVQVEQSPVDLLKAVKNQVEIAGMQHAHFQDGLALTLWLAWVETLSPEEVAAYNEVSAARVLEEFRRLQPSFVALSFPTISGVNSNGAIIHYRAEEESCSKLDPAGMLLVDSGAHYVGGTTDVTRTVHLGKPSDLQKELYTRVLMGHLDLAAAVFPQNTYGCQLDPLARRHLWKIGFDYLHGTGHGVGHSMEVHEAPPNISKVCPPSFRDVPFQPGMVVSNEPGAYVDGQFGIRIESLIYCRTVAGPFRFNNVDYLGFDELTLAPYCKKLIKKELLSPDQVKQINAYHKRVLQAFMPFFDPHAVKTLIPESAGKNFTPKLFEEWLRETCSPL
ncbi:Xaa-pro aminopeptidase [Gregarina niphandrodes]|uniref:Xaa-pro aminopeptidase n=1 Tax=Gregarina niphandrodes TaxID=110365 RepID=A0A023BBB1_GRENI|nr:Xaa-pro aminopeptidase [Gregarina niphandrodes]EZG79401.1 Xaa-pro aminopeptidase [Gregarina niphandrodes]|eukprot:XP_011129048.1 Xaa-pro aminopeptidase [Gregarina niphandrodes]